MRTNENWLEFETDELHACHRNFFEFLVDLMIRKCYSSENCPSWWPKDVPFCILSGMVRSAQPNSRYVQNSLLLSYCVCFRAHSFRPEKKGIGSFLGEMSGAIHNVSFYESTATSVHMITLLICMQK